MQSKLIELLPQQIADIQEFKSIMDTEDKELDSIQEYQQRILYENFIDTASEHGIKHQEKLFKIRADLSIEDLEFRKLRLKNRKMDKVPFTYRFLEHKLESLFGKDNYKIELENNIYTLKVEVHTFDYNTFNEIINNFREIIPCDIILESLMVSEIESNLKLQTDFEKYDIVYDMCGTFLCGTRPDISTDGVTFNESLSLSTSNDNINQKYNLTGTFNAGGDALA